VTHPAIRELFEGLGGHAAFLELVRRIQRGEKSLSLSGLTTTAKALYLVLLAHAVERPLIVIVDGNKQAESLSEIVGTFWDLLATSSRDGQRPLLLPALDVLPHQHLSPHNEIAEQRAIGLWRLATRTPPVTITPIASALLRTETRDFYRQLALSLRNGDEIALDDVTAHLDSIGYQRREPVELVGEYSVRGGILDVFPAEADKPVRIEFFGDSIESMRRFDVETQRSVLEIKDTLLLPLIEYPRTRELFHDLAPFVDRSRAPVPGEEFAGWEFYVPIVRPRTESVLSMARDAVVVWDEPEQVAGAAERLWKRLEDPERPHPVPPATSFFMSSWQK
jgi:transcription-repair coupling factor (superfamily II helicase)